MKNILLLNDLPGYGQVALSASMPILTGMGNCVFHIPTALISNTLDFGKFEMLDTTEYMKRVLKVWDELHFQIDAVSVGFIGSEEQAQFLVDFCGGRSEKGTLIFCDPIMADHGKLYNGITQDKIQSMRKIVGCADYCTPNYTEAVFLTDSDYGNGIVSREKIRNIIDKLRGIGVKSVVVTSVELEEKNVVAGYDHLSQEYFFIPYEKIPVSFPGTGDIFSALMTGKILEGNPLRESVEYAVRTVWNLIDKNRDCENKHNVLITSFLEEKKNA